MADEQLGDILDAMRARIQAQLDAQIQALTARHEQALARARSEAEAEAERRWSSKVDAVRAEWTARLQAEVAAARNEAEKRLVAEAVRAKTEAEQAATEAASRARRELEQALAAERQRSSAELAAERRRAQQEIERTTAALEAQRQQREADEAALVRSARGADPRALLDAMSRVRDAHTLSDGLAALVKSAAALAPRAALFVVNGTQLDEWTVAGMPQLSQLPLDVQSDAAGVLGAAVRRAERVSTGEAAAPAFAGLPPGGLGAAMPLVVGGDPVAVLYADEGRMGTGQDAGWMDAVELLTRHSAACLAELTAMRALQVLSGAGSNGRSAAPSVASSETDESARRYAKLLVSEIKLYNESAVRLGRERRDLLQRLGPEIERARRLFEDRVPPSIAARGAYFHDELVQTLADGDPGLLGH